MRGIKCVQVILCCLAALVIAQNNRTISEVYVNLPATCAECRKVRYELTAFSGCYSWVTFNPRIVSLDQVPDASDCNSKAIISAIVSTPLKTVVIIKANDAVTKESLISQVKVSKISELRILTNFKAIDVDDVQKLYIQAFDESNNVISSVEGLRFEWKVETNQQALKIITSKEANYENTFTRLEMENKRMQTDLILVRGMQTGIVDVSARLLEKDYEIVGMARISLFVIEPFFLIPDKPIYLLTSSTFVYRIGKGKRKIKGQISQYTKITEVKLPDAQYHFLPSNYELLTTQESGAVLTQDKIGEVLVRVEDTTLTNNTVEGLIYVVEPEAVELSIKDITAYADGHSTMENLIKMGEISESGQESGEGLNNWNLVEGHTYVVTSYLQDFAKNIIYITPNVEFDVSYLNDYFSYLGGNQQKSIMVFKAVKQTLTAIKLKSVLVLQTVSKYKSYAERDIRIATKVFINHPTNLVLLPYLARTKIRSEKKEQDAQMWTLEATGGFGSYRWESSNSAIASVTAQGIVYGLKLGSTRAFAYDVLNKLNNDSIEVEVARVGKLEWLEEKLELATTAIEVLNAIALDYKGRKFTNCTSVPFEWSVKDEMIVKLKDESLDSPYLTLKNYVAGENKELIKLRHYYDSKTDGSADIDDLKSSLIGIGFIEKRELHNMFGICGQREVSIIREGTARISYSFQITEEDGMAYRRESGFLQILAYKALRTMSPNYDLFLRSLKKDEKDETHKRFIQTLKSESEFVLGFGSGLYWEVEGGSSRWVDLPLHYFEDVSVYPSPDKSDVKLLVKPVYIGAVKSAKPYHYIECSLPSDVSAITSTKEHSFKLTLKAGNRRARSLLRPAVTSLTIEVFCQLPQSVLLAFSQKQVGREEIKFDKLPKREPEGDGEGGVYHIQNGRTEYIRLLAFDKYKRLFYNFSSYQSAQSVTNNELASISMLDSYDMHILRLTEKMGSFYVKSQFIALYDSYARQLLSLDKISGSILISSVNKLKAEPEYKLLYLDARNKLTVNLLYGSGSFVVKTNSSAIIDMQYDYRVSSRVIVVTPIREGYAQIIIEDIGVTGASTAICTILVSDVHKTFLEQDLLLERNTESNIYLTHFGLSGEEFSSDQYKYMTVQLTQERKRSVDISGFTNAEDRTRVGLEIIRESEESSYNSYTVKARVLGSYEVVAVTQKKEVGMVKLSDVYSNPIWIEVFPPCDVTPKRLLLMPEGTYIIKASGGPSSIETGAGYTSTHFGGSIARQFRIENSNIASIDPVTGEVTAHKVGQTKAYVVITQEVRSKKGLLEYHELCKNEIPVIVELVTDVEIIGVQNRPLMVGSTVRLLAVLKHYNETFLFGVFPVEYVWTSKHFHIYSLHSGGRQAQPGSRDAISTSIQTDQQGVDGRANRAGEAEVFVFISIMYPEEYKYTRSEFNISVIVRVVDSLHGKVETFIDEPFILTSTYLIPPNTVHKLPLYKENKMKLSYFSLCEQILKKSNVLTVTEDGTIRTFEHYGSSTIIFEDSSPFDRLRSAYYIEVAPIISIIIEHGAQIITMPLGADVELRVILQDKFGRSFAHPVEGIQIILDVSHPKVLRASFDYYNGTLTVRALGIGVSNLHIYFPGNEYVFDIIKVHVTSIIEPPSPVYLHAGGTVQFITSYNYSSMGRSIWSSDDSRILQVDPQTGLGVSRSEGTTNAHINDTFHMTTTVTCEKIGSIHLDLSTSPKILTNVEKHPQYKAQYRTQYKLFLEGSNVEATPDPSKPRSLISHKIHFECKSLSPAWIFARSETEETKGQVETAVCLLYPRAGSISESSPSTISIQVSAGSKEMQYMKDEVFTFPFASAFKAHSAREIILSRTSRSKVIKVTGSTELKLWVEDPSLVEARSMMSESDKVIEVQVTIPRDVERTFKHIKLYMENPLTGQKEDFLISYFHEVLSPEETESKASSGWPIMEILTILILIVSIVIVVKYVMYTNQPVEENARPRYPQYAQQYRTPVPPHLGNPGLASGRPNYSPINPRRKTPIGSTNIGKNTAHNLS